MDRKALTAQVKESASAKKMTDIDTDVEIETEMDVDDFGYMLLRLQLTN